MKLIASTTEDQFLPEQKKVEIETKTEFIYHSKQIQLDLVTKSETAGQGTDTI